MYSKIFSEKVFSDGAFLKSFSDDFFERSSNDEKNFCHSEKNSSAAEKYIEKKRESSKFSSEFFDVGEKKGKKIFEMRRESRIFSAEKGSADRK